MRVRLYAASVRVFEFFEASKERCDADLAVSKPFPSCLFDGMDGESRVLHNRGYNTTVANWQMRTMFFL